MILECRHRLREFSLGDIRRLRGSIMKSYEI